MILVAGASGLLGREICRALADRGERVRALVRSSSPGKSEVAALGAEIAEGDLRDPAGLPAICRGVETVLTTANGQNRRVPGDSLTATDRAPSASRAQVGSGRPLAACAAARLLCRWESTWRSMET